MEGDYICLLRYRVLGKPALLAVSDCIHRLRRQEMLGASGFYQSTLTCPSKHLPSSTTYPIRAQQQEVPCWVTYPGNPAQTCPKNMQCVGADGCHNVPLALGWTQAFQHTYFQLSDSLNPGVRWVDKASGLSLRAIVPPTQLLLPCQVKEGPIGRVISVCGTLLPRATADGKCTRI